MVCATPQDELRLVATSAADDASFVALHDVATLLHLAEFQSGMLIGGHMVSLHAQRWGLTLPRATLDADLGIPQLALKTTNVTDALRALNYERERPNRFSKPLPGRSADGDSGPSTQCVIDILVPSLTSRARKKVVVGDVTTIEVPGLAEALNRSPTLVVAELTRRNGDILNASIKIQDERSALILKAMAWNARGEGKDAIDVWRCLEIAYAASLGPEAFDSNDGRESMAIVEREFMSSASGGLRALAAAEKLSPNAIANKATRIRALVQKIAT
jgi:hypothetical protein